MNINFGAEEIFNKENIKISKYIKIIIYNKYH